MAEKTEFLQAIDDAILDADSLEQFINGSESETVLTRLNAEYPTLQKALKVMFEKGSMPADPYLTKESMLGGSTEVGSYAVVTNDPVKRNNGFYIRNASGYTYLNFNLTNEIERVNNLLFYPSESDPDISGEPTELWAAGDGLWKKMVGYSGTIYNVDPGSQVYIEASSNPCYIVFLNELPEVGDVIEGQGLQTIKPLSTGIYEVPPNYSHLWVSEKSLSSSRSPSIINLNFGEKQTNVISLLKNEIKTLAYIKDILNAASATDTTYWVSAESTWVRPPGFLGRFYELDESSTYTISANSNRPCYYTLLNSLPTAISTPTENPLITLNGGEVGSFTATKDTKYLWVSVKNATESRLPESIKVSANNDLLYKSSFIDYLPSQTEQLSTTPVSAKLAGRLRDEIRSTRAEALKLTEIDTNISTGVYFTAFSIRTKSTILNSYDLNLEKGDELVYEYDNEPFLTTLWYWGDSNANRFSLHTSLLEDFSVKAENTFTAFTDMKVRITGSSPDRILVNGEVVDPSLLEDIGVWEAEKYTVRKDVGNNLVKSTGFIALREGDYVEITECPLGFSSITRWVSASSSYEILGLPSDYTGSRRVSWTADRDSEIALTGTLDSSFYIRRKGAAEAEAEDGYLRNYVPPTLDLGELTTVFATDKNMILKNEVIDEVDTILTSTDLGKTWAHAENIVGKIVSYHIFSDGTVFLCSASKTYWMDGDYTQLNESTIYDHDGTPFVAAEGVLHNHMLQNGNQIAYIGDTEMYVWGEYKLKNTTSNRLWYTTDRGRTVKCAIKFNETVLDGKVRPIRHFHMVTFREKDNRFYITTGDVGDECFIASGGYDVASDTWDWKVYNSGNYYKFGDIYFDDYHAYLMTDFTLSTQQDEVGFYRVPVTDLGDFSKYQAIYKPNRSELSGAAFSRFMADSNGNKIIFPDYKGVGRCWMARDGMDFKVVKYNPSVGLTFRLGVNYNGDTYLNASNVIGEYLDEQYFYLNKGSYNLTKALRNAGVTDFMAGGYLFDGLWITR